MDLENKHHGFPGGNIHIGTRDDTIIYDRISIDQFNITVDTQVFLYYYIFGVDSDLGIGLV